MIDKERVKQDLGALKIALIYLVVGGLWILFSDGIAETTAKDRYTLTLISIAKGWGYVVVTALLLYWLIQRYTIALNDSRTRVTGIINSAMDAIISIDHSHHIVLFNPAAEKMFGYTADEIMGQSLDILIPKNYQTEHLRQIDKFGQTGITNRQMNGYQEITGKKKNGDEFPIDISISQINTNGQKLFTAILRDVTARKQAEEKILSLSRFPDENPSPVLRVAQDGKILYANRAGADILKTWKREIHQSVPDEWQTHIRQVLESGLNIEIEIESFDKFFSCILSPIRDAGYVNIYCRDITERKQVEQAVRQSEERLRLSLQAANQGLYDLNLQSGMAIVNREYAQMLGYDPETFVETNTAWIERLHPDDREITAKMYADYINGLIPEYRVEFRQKMKDGNWKWILSLGKVVEYDMEGKPLRMLGTHADITNRKQAEEEIRLLNENLEQRIAERTAQLENANRELESFSYSVSHDLRSPLRGIDGWSLALLEDYGHLLDEHGQAHIQRVRAETQRMGILIDDILHLSRITRAEMHKENVDLSAIAESVAVRLEETKPKDRQVEFVIQKGLTATGDPKLLDVVLTNLLDNAFKFTGRKQEADIEFGQTVVEGANAFYVRDNGAGFDMAYANKLFGVFQRMHSSSEFPGTGIGLATVQRIINRHGGSIWASSEVGDGATFYFTLEDNK